LPELEVFRAIDFAHAAASEQPHDSVALQQHGARNKAGAIHRTA
jgi:hypothetical protein